jgi:hypothetical protein
LQNCKFRADFVSFKENKEYEAILNRLMLEALNGVLPFLFLSLISYRQNQKARKCIVAQVQPASEHSRADPS